ncbi:MAG: flavodoxin family protein, partial [Clostridiales Family XIII bacterium]|nr:flavodoxin family protein [Clostridiales Family XIII bacterium]
MNTLILNGSPRIEGDTAALLHAFSASLHGSVTELSVYRDQINPCVDCRYCLTHKGCAISDDMQTVYRDDFDNLIIASPLYYGTLTGPMIALASRLQVYHSIQPAQHSPRVLRPKRG